MIRFDNGNENFWEEYARFLQAEIDLCDDARRKGTLLCALARIHEERLSSAKRAWDLLGEAVELMPSDPDVLWEAWRNGSRRDIESKMRVLELLSIIQDRPRDIVSCRVQMAKLRRDVFRDEVAAHAELKEALWLTPDGRDVLWTQVETQLGLGETASAVEPLDQLADLSADPLWKASLYCAVASMNLRSGAPSEKVEASLVKALEQPHLDWADANDILRTCMEIEHWPQVDRALGVMAEAAERRESTSHVDRPDGWGFDAFDRGDDVAAALWWHMALVRERRLGDLESAVAALRRAIALAPEQPFLQIELVRLLETQKKFAEALELLPKHATTAWRAQLALSAGRPELVAPLLAEDQLADASLVGAVIRELAKDPKDSPPRKEASNERLVTWFLLHPNHEQTYEVALSLVEKGADCPVAAIAVEEGGPADTIWPIVDTSPSAPLWSLAVEAVWFGREETPSRVAQRFVTWAQSTKDATLCSVLYSLAGLLMEENEAKAAEALELFKKAQERTPRASVARDGVLRLLKQLGRWKELSQGLSDAAVVAKDELRAIELLYQKSIVEEQGVRDSEEALRLYEDLAQRDPTDLFALLACARLRFANLDYLGAAETLVRLAEQCPEESARLRLLAGELSLFTLGSYPEALEHFDFAAQSQDEFLAQAARLYRLYVLFQLGDAGALDQALQEEALLASTEQEDFWIAELLETGRAARGASALADLLEHDLKKTPVRLLWSAMVGQKNSSSSMVSDAFVSLGELAPPGTTSGACKTAASILEAARSKEASAAGSLAPEDYQSEEMLCWTTEQNLEKMEPVRRAELLIERSRLAADYDGWECLEWLLEAAEAYEESGQLQRALTILGEALSRSPEHPGLLEASARVALANESFVQAAETRLRLSRFFEVPDERAAQMAMAAKIHLDNLADDTAAERIGRQALDLRPGHAGAHDVLVRIYRKRGDDAALAELIEKRISAERSADELVRLYQEQSDQLLSLDDTEGSLAALEKLLELDSGRLDAHHTRIELLAQMGRWEDALEAMAKCVSSATQLKDIRPICWRASEVAQERLNDPRLAYTWLEKLAALGDEHPETQKRICDLALRLERFEEAVTGFEKLASVTDDPQRRSALLVQQARVLLEALFDGERASKIAEEVLSSAPDHLEMLRLAQTFRSPAELSRDLAGAKLALRDKLAGGEDFVANLEKLGEVAELGNEAILGSFCADALSALRGQRFDRPVVDPIAAVDGASNELRGLVTHPDREHPASSIAFIARCAAADVFAKREHLPVFGKGTLVGRKMSDPVEEWLQWWAEALGVHPVELHRVDLPDSGIIKLPREKAAVAVSPKTNPPLSNAQRFELVRNMWLSHAGLGGFVDGDASGPVRWVLAVTAAVLGEDSDLPASTDRALVQMAKKALSRKMRKALEKPCEELLAVSPQSLRAWAVAEEMSADRFGFLAAPSVSEVLEVIAVGCAASHGKEQLAKKPTQILLGLPRCRDLIGFAVSSEHMNAREILGMAGPDANGS